MRSPRRRIAITGLLGGGAAGLLLLAPAVAGAVSPAAGSVTQAPPTTEPSESDVAAEPATDAAGGRHEEHLRDVLQPLVDDGTLTAEQAEAVVAAMREAGPNRHDRPMIMHGGPGFPGPMGFPDEMGFPHGVPGPGFPGDIDIIAGGPRSDMEPGIPFGPFAVDIVAETVGIDVSDLVTQIMDGSSVAEIADANGVDPQTVIDALVQDAEDRLAAAVDRGRITQAEADERLANISERIANWVDGVTESGTEETGDETGDTADDTDETAAPPTTTG